MRALLAVCALWALACSVDPDANPSPRCSNDGDCLASAVCYRGFCVAAGEVDAGRAADGGDAGDGVDGGVVVSDAGPLVFDGGPGRCAEGATISCYDGPPTSLGRGLCAVGTRACLGGMFSLECVGQVLPIDELCNGDDDDCDGSSDEGFDLNGDPLHCGACGVACAMSEACTSGVCCSADRMVCGSACVDLATDPSNCGGCGTECRGSTRLCCAGACMRMCP